MKTIEVIIGCIMIAAYMGFGIYGVIKLWNGQFNEFNDTNLDNKEHRQKS